jgi:hypothetical protein
MLGWFTTCCGVEVVVVEPVGAGTADVDVVAGADVVVVVVIGGRNVVLVAGFVVVVVDGFGATVVVVAAPALTATNAGAHAMTAMPTRVAFFG